MNQVTRVRLIATVRAIVGMMGQPDCRDEDGFMITIMIMDIIIIMTMGMARGRLGGKEARMHMRRFPNLKAAGRKR